MTTPQSQVYLLLGEEDWLIDRALGELLDHLIPEAERDLNLDVVRAEEIELADLLTRVDTLPFFGRRRVVVVRGADAWNAADQEKLAGYLEQGPPPSALIVIASALDRRRKLYTAIRKMGVVQEYPRLALRQLPAWIQDRVRREGRRIDPDAVEALSTLVGPSLRQLSLEMEKLFAFTHGRERITRSDVEEAVSRTSETTIFKLADAIGERRASDALRALNDILMDEAPPYVLFMIARQFRMLMRVSLFRGGKPTMTSIQETVGVPPFVARKLLEQVKNFPPESFQEIFARLLETDRAIKTRGQDRLALETLVASLCLPPRPAARGAAGARGTAG